MNNENILQLIENQRKDLFNKLNGTTISRLYKQEYQDIKSGRIFILNNGEREMLSDLKKWARDKSNDDLISDKLNEFLNLDNEALIKYFVNEIEKVFDKILKSKKQDEIQALFIEYDYYYHFKSCVICYGKQEYPIIEEPRYIDSEYDYSKQILLIEDGVNFQPAWLDCEEFSEFDYLEIEDELEKMFQHNSKILLHKALKKLDNNNKLNFLKNRPFSFYINEHVCEVMMLYKLN